MYGHKESFLPLKRDLYDALDSESGFHRFGQRSHFTDPFSSDTQAMITLPIEENLMEIDFAQLYTEIEVKAVMKIKMRFFDWFESMVKVIIERNNSRVSNRRREEVKKLEESHTVPHEEPSQELGSFLA